MNEINNVPISPDSNTNLLQAKIIKLKEKKRSSLRLMLGALVGLLVGFGLCASQLAMFGLIILAVAALILFVSIIDNFLASSQLGHFEKQLKSGETMSELSGVNRVMNGILAVILAFLAIAVVGWGLCLAIIPLINL